MQLKLSILTCSVLSISSLLAEDYINVQYINYNEDNGRTTILAPSVEINKNFGTDYVLNLSYVADTLSGATPTYFDSSSGASASSKGVVAEENIKYDNIDYKDERQAGGIMLTKRFESRNELTVGANVSREYDYNANELSAEYLFYLDKSKNQSISIGASYQQNEILINCKFSKDGCDGSSGPSEIVDGSSGASEIMDLKVMSGEIAFTKILNKTSFIKTSLFYAQEDGYLNNPYMGIIRNSNTNIKITQENKPNKRVSYGSLMQYSKALGKKISTVSSFRWYYDDWNIASITVSSEMYYEFTKSFTTGIGARYYTQSRAKFYNSRKDYFSDEKYASSDRRMSQFYAINYKLYNEFKITDRLSIDTSISYYNQPDYFDALYYTGGIKYKF